MTNEERMERAGDYVLGLMDEAERARAERDLQIDPAFRDAVLILAQRFHVIDTVGPHDPVPERMWQDIAERIAQMPQMARVLEPLERPATSVPGGPTPGTAPARRWFPAGGAQRLALAASLLVACGLGYLGGRMLPGTEEPVVMVVLVDDSAEPGAIVEAYADDRVRIVPLRDFAVPAGKTLEVWTLYDQAVGPVSLGTFQTVAEVSLRGPDQPRPRAEQLYEITLEDAPGSPIGKPTGPILAKGFAKAPIR